MAPPVPQVVELDTLINDYAVFFIDQFGVLHDGQTPYPGAVNALKRIKQAGHRIVLISNSGKRASVNENRVQRLGFMRDSYDLFLTSGEVAWQQMKTTLIGNTISRHGNCLLLARDDDASAIDGLGLNRVASAAQADVIVISGCRDDVTMDEYDALLADGLTRNVPCLCTDPDKKMLTGAGIKFGAGEIAQRYADQGGDVTWIGKPYPAIYEAALAALNDPDPEQVVCIGDSVEHDIAGGHNVGLDTALVKTGIAQDLDDDAQARLFQQFGVTPTHVLATFGA